MAMTTGPSNKKELNFELNLLPIFDVLSVCICFLLMTVVWVQVGAMNTSQAVGGQSQEETKKPPTVWVTFAPNGAMTLSFKNTRSKMNDITIKTTDYNQIKNRISKLDKNLEMALLMPAANTSYDNIIQVMDLFRQAGVKDVGISPL